MIILNKKLTIASSEDEVQQVIQSEQQELHRRQSLYRRNKPFPTLKDKIIILVDDGIATGATIRVAIKALKKQKPHKLIIAIPVAAPSIIAEISELVDKVICPLRPFNLYAVGVWYDNFSQTTDEEVFQLLRG